MVISNLKVDTGSEVVISVDIKWESEHLVYEKAPKKLWFASDIRNISRLTIDRYDSFAVSMLYPAIRNGETRLHIMGAISARLFDNLHRVAEIINFSLSKEKNFKPQYLNITCDKLESKTFKNNIEIGTGLSMGVDSLCSFYEYFEQCSVPEFKITKLFLFNVGSFDNLKDAANAENVFNAKKIEREAFAKCKGLELITLNSNMHEFMIWGHGRTEAITGMAAILMFQPFCHRYYWASAGWNYGQIFKYYDTELGFYMAIFDPIFIGLLSTESLQIVSQGIELTRMQKVEMISDYKTAHALLDVCVLPNLQSKNCGTCVKCLRTLLSIELLGKLDLFSNVFDIDKYLKSWARKRFIARQVIRNGSDPYAEDFVCFARKKGISLWTKSSISAFVVEYVRYLLTKVGIVRRLFLKYMLKRKNVRL